jgi:hypothetical protein
VGERCAPGYQIDTPFYGHSMTPRAFVHSARVGRCRRRPRRSLDDKSLIGGTGAWHIGVDLTTSAEAELEPLYSMSHWNAPPAGAGRFNGLDSAGT